MSRDQAAAYEPSEAYEVCISITDLDAPVPKLSDAFQDILRVSFSDLDQHHVERLGEAQSVGTISIRALTAQQAQGIVQFYRQHRKANRMIVHCEAGVSRSVGVARALAELEGATKSESKIIHGRGNRLVRERVLEAAGVGAS